MRVHRLYKGPDPILFGHKKDVPTLSKYVRVASHVYYTATLLVGWFALWAVEQKIWDAEYAPLLLPLVFMVPPAVFVYLFLVYRQFWYVAQAPTVAARVTKFVYGVWMVLFLIINFFQMYFLVIAPETMVFSFRSIAVSYGHLTFGINVAVGFIGELLLKKLSKLISNPIT